MTTDKREIPYFLALPQERVGKEAKFVHSYGEHQDECDTEEFQADLELHTHDGTVPHCARHDLRNQASMDQPHTSESCTMSAP